MNFFKANVPPFYLRLSLVMVGILSLGYLTVLGKEILCPLVFALLFSLVLLPLCKFFENKLKFPRGAAAALSVIILIAVISGLLYLVASEITGLAKDWPVFKSQLISSLDKLQTWISAKFHVNLEKQMAYISSTADKLASHSTAMIGATVVSVTSMILFIVFIIIDTFFLLFYRHHFLQFIIKAFREENSKVVYDITEQVQFIIRKYILGLLLEMLIVASVCCIVFLILGIKYAILLGLITGLFNIIPYVGIYTALLLNVIITFGTGASGSVILLIVITVISMHLIDSNILLPLIVGSKVQINPFITLIGVVLGEQMWGLSGMFLSIPVIAIAKIIFDRIESLQPWGMLMGEEGQSQTLHKKKPLAMRKRTVIENENHK